MGSTGTVLRGLVRLSGGPERVMGPQSSKFSHFCNPYGVICTFSRAQHGTEHESENSSGRPFGRLKSAVGTPKKS